MKLDRKPFDQEVLNSIPCEPMNSITLLRLLDEQNVALTSLSLLFERDIVLSLKVIDSANRAMRAQDLPPDVRNVAHALALLGFDNVHTLVKNCQVLQGDKNSVLNKVYRATLAKAQVLLSMVSAFAPCHPSVNLDDTKLYMSLLVLGHLDLAVDAPESLNVLLTLNRHHNVDFWTGQGVVLTTTLIDRALHLSSGLSIPLQIQQTLHDFPGSQHFINDKFVVDIKCLQRYFKLARHQQNIQFPLVLACYCLMQQAPVFWGNKGTMYLVKWISRLVNRPTDTIWQTAQKALLKGVQTYPVLHDLGKALLASDWPKSQTYAEIKQTLVNYYDSKSEDDSKARVVADKAPGPTLTRYIHDIRANPQAYGASSSTSAALLEAARVGLDAEFCVALKVDSTAKSLFVNNVAGLASKHWFRQFEIKIAQSGLLGQFLGKPAAVWISTKNRQKLQESMPADIRLLVGENQIFICSTRNRQNQLNGLVIVIAKEQEYFSESMYQAFLQAVKLTLL